jgi:hypothetical protein
MPERAPTPERLAELYDLLDPWDPGDDLHLGLVMARRPCWTSSGAARR